MMEARASWIRNMLHDEVNQLIDYTRGDTVTVQQDQDKNFDA